MRDLLLYRLKLGAQELVRCSSLSKREIIRRLGCSPAQDCTACSIETNYRTSFDGLLALFAALDEVTSRWAAARGPDSGVVGGPGPRASPEAPGHRPQEVSEPLSAPTASRRA